MLKLWCNCEQPCSCSRLLGWNKCFAKVNSLGPKLTRPLSILSKETLKKFLKMFITFNKYLFLLFSYATRLKILFLNIKPLRRSKFKCSYLNLKLKVVFSEYYRKKNSISFSVPTKHKLRGLCIFQIYIILNIWVQITCNFSKI